MEGGERRGCYVGDEGEGWGGEGRERMVLTKGGIKIKYIISSRNSIIPRERTQSLGTRNVLLRERRRKKEREKKGM